MTFDQFIYRVIAHKSEDRVVIVVRNSTVIPDEVKATLRDLGIRWVATDELFEGYSDVYRIAASEFQALYAYDVEFDSPDLKYVVGRIRITPNTKANHKGIHLYYPVKEVKQDEVQ